QRSEEVVLHLAGRAEGAAEEGWRKARRCIGGLQAREGALEVRPVDVGLEPYESAAELVVVAALQSDERAGAANVVAEDRRPIRIVDLVVVDGGAQVRAGVEARPVQNRLIGACRAGNSWKS